MHSYSVCVNIDKQRKCQSAYLDSLKYFDKKLSMHEIILIDIRKIFCDCCKSTFLQWHALYLHIET